MRFEGTIKTWNDERGFGFIEAEAGGEPIFFHVSSMTARAGRPAVGSRVSFQVESGAKGKRAKAVSPVRPAKIAPRPRTETPAKWGPASLLAVPALVVTYWYVSRSTSVSLYWLLAYGILSIVTFFAYAFDKAAAVQRTWRTSESTLLSLGLLCGWPGALIAQQVLRHKSSKTSFRIAFWFTVVLNLVIFVSAHTSYGQALLGRAGPL
jgi:uncharacterized membrane protein YsdA (DUF1294 family)/cold shock CspA family protein